MLLLLCCAALATAAPPETVVIRNADVTLSPDQRLTRADIVIHDGIVTAIGTDLVVPAGARVVPAEGLMAYPGFIDGCTLLGVRRPARNADDAQRLADPDADVRDGPQVVSLEGYREQLWPQTRAVDTFDPRDKAVDAARSAGFTTALIAPHPGILGGHSAVVALGNAPLRLSIRVMDFAQHAGLQPVRDDSADRGLDAPRRYPATGMGATAALRQMFLDAGWHADLRDWTTRHPDEPMAVDPDLDALHAVLQGHRPLVLHADSRNEIQRALDLAAEFGIRPIIVGGAEAWRIADRLRAEARGVVLCPVWPKMPERPRRVPPPGGTVLFDDHWEAQPFEPQRTLGERQREWGEQVDNAQRLIDAGVPFAFGTLNAVARERERPSDELLANLRTAHERGLSQAAVLDGLTRQAARLLGISGQSGEIAVGRPAHIALWTGPFLDGKSRVHTVFVEGDQFDVAAQAGERKPPKDDDSREADAGRDDPAAPESLTATAMAPEFRSAVEADRRPAWPTGGNLVIRGATVWSGDAAPQRADVLIENGRIARIGDHVTAPPQTPTLTLRGYHITPGLIDAHSHMCIDGGVNEHTLSVTPEVRIADVVDPDDIGAYRALAGGVTTIHTMHGSANTIGGQNTVLHLAYGDPVEAWRFPEAPRTVKFALGENVKQSNFGIKGMRYPNSRMGVEVVLRAAFDRAQRYVAERDAAGDRPQRRDLRLEALAEVLAGNLWVHCHCYRADEVLRLLDVAEAHGFRIAVLQHILEGYRILPEIHRHGAAASTFSDWWAYKLEAYNAVPHNAARMHDAGIVTTVNSDSAEVIRHLPVEAAKAVRFGDLDAVEALSLITRHAATQLGISDHAGTLRAGRRADVAVFNGHPLDTTTRCVMTLLAGEPRFIDGRLDPDDPAPPRPAYEPPAARPPIAVTPHEQHHYCIVHGHIVPVDGQPIPDGLLTLTDGRITAVQAYEPTAVPPGATVIDASGLLVYPGLINAGTSLGLTEIGSVHGSVDVADIAPLEPELQALSAYNPFSAAIDVTRSAGVTAALVAPAFRAVGVRGDAVRPVTIAGRAGVVQLQGWSMPEAILAPDAALCVQLPSWPIEYPALRTKDQTKRHHERRTAHRAQLLELQRFFERAQAYARGRAAGAGAVDRVYETMVPFLTGERPVLFEAHDYKQIREALAFAEHFELRPIITGGREAWKLADELALRRIPVIIEKVTSMPGSRFEPWDGVYRNAAELAAAGVPFCFATGGAALAKQLGLEAGLAVAHGLEPDRAIRALTLDAAAILDIDAHTGSLTPGKRGDVIVTTAPPYQVTAAVVLAFIDGRPIDLTNQHTRLDQQFRERPSPALPPATHLNGCPPMRLP